MQSADLDRAVAETVGKLRKQLFVKNAQGVSELWNSFSVADADGSGALDRDEFNEALHHAGVFLTTQEIGSVFRKFDANGNGVLEYEEFVNAVVPPLEGERLRLVKLAFARVDESGRGIVSADSLRQAYRADKHPRVESGELSEDAVADQVLGGLPDGEVSEDDFVNHFRNLSVGIPSDDFFLHMMERCWGFRANPVAAEREYVDELAGMLRSKIFERTGGRKYEFRSLHELFCLVDEDESGMLNRRELGLAFEYVGIPLSEKQLDAVFTVFDADGNSQVSWRELVRFCYPEVSQDAAV